MNRHRDVRGCHHRRRRQRNDTCKTFALIGAVLEHMPKRIQRKRSKGWQMPEGAVYVGRPSRWGNPYKAKECANGATGAVQCFRVLVESEEETVAEIRRELRGKDLACWCPLNKPCHADVLLEVANS